MRFLNQHSFTLAAAVALLALTLWLVRGGLSSPRALLAGAALTAVLGIFLAFRPTSQAFRDPVDIAGPLLVEFMSPY